MTDDNDDSGDEERPAEPGSGDTLDEIDGEALAHLDLERMDDPWDEPDIDTDSAYDFTSVIVLRAREPFEEWARRVGGYGPEWTFPAIERCHAFLTPELPRQSDADAWLQQNYAELFNRQLETWAEDDAQWPTDRSFDAFLSWFEVVFAPTVEDMRAAEPPLRAVTCAPLSLCQVLEEFLRLPADGSLHVEIATGELFAWTDDELEAIHAGDAEGIDLPPGDMRALQEAFASESLIEIVHRAEVDNIDTMVAFVATVEPQTIRNRLLGALQGKRARRRFIEAIEVARLRHRWTAWFEGRAADTLRDFLSERGVPYVDDLASAEPEAQRDDD